MATIGVPQCVINSTNSGSGKCAFKKDKDIYVIGSSGDYVLTPAKALDFLNTLKTDSLAARNSRLYFFGAFTNSEDELIAATMDEFANGNEDITRYEVLRKSMELRGATRCDQEALMSLRQTQKDLKFFFVQANGQIRGQAQWNATTSQTEMVGYSADFVDVPVQTAGTYDAAPISYLKMKFVNERANENNEVYIDLNDTQGLFAAVKTVLDTYRVTTLSLEKAAATPSASGVFAVKLSSSCTRSFGVDYASVIDKTLFTVTNMTTGLALVITTAVANAATGVITITLTTPPTAGTVMRVTVNGVSAFSALGMKYFEGLNYVEFTNV